ncbi:hypothetical protein A2716_04520 [candidate division WWE3 bacterium RIFCSPHIGHO2_01_FULL_40_23]|uniref:ABC transporter domain-containing protein n=1 Tax=candidate division WWE3 bacterium RIFCSPLOWO2_01_FULL_41_18 TaxID=1802625 RepID=A0A1F4VDA7_UNCKA|nr:MAG: hypothetical protein A2716_04520 [candidate division WWE3 bacterium RIFCSPHIGHO2_01_FULL_40_23]OGC55137.1 MAG: hypothetical protein A3A78_04130 [candidate division WWE3 bacterium RIFCSPLOWO2_01_FULL_41_18]
MNEEVSPENKEIQFREFINIAKWCVKLIFKNEPWALSLMVIGTVLIQLRGIVYSYLFSKMLDALIKTAQTPNANVMSLYPYLGVLFAYYILSNIIFFIRNVARTTLNTRSRPKMRRELFDKLHSLGIQTLEDPEVNNKIHRADESLTDIVPFLQQTVDLVASFIKMTVSAIIIFRFLPQLIILIFIAHIPYFFNDRRFRGLLWKFSLDTTEGQRRAGWSSGYLISSSSLHEVYINGAFKFLSEKYLNFHNWFSSERIKLQKKWLSSTYSSSLLADLVVLSGYIRLFGNFIRKQISIGDVAFQGNMISSLSDSIIDVLNMTNELMGLSLRLRDTYSLFQTRSGFTDGENILPKLESGPEIEFKNVKFKYPKSEKHIFENLNLTIKPNEKIAIVGHNGAGKTTLIKLICRFYQVEEGSIQINGININDISTESLYKNLGVLFQDYNNYSHLTVKENIYIGNTNDPINDTAVRLAAMNADASEFIEEFPNKFDQILSEKFKGGTRPSTGQWQKIAIARFFYRNAPLVIFDEPTASIDAVSEYNIFNKIYEFFKGKTVIIISHRFSTVRNADRIIVLDKGEIIEEGSHTQLMNKNGHYAKAFLLQAEGYSQ